MSADTALRASRPDCGRRASRRASGEAGPYIVGSSRKGPASSDLRGDRAPSRSPPAVSEAAVLGIGSAARRSPASTLAEPGDRRGIRRPRRRPPPRAPGRSCPAGDHAGDAATWNRGRRSGERRGPASRRRRILGLTEGRRGHLAARGERVDRRSVEREMGRTDSVMRGLLELGTGATLFPECVEGSFAVGWAESPRPTGPCDLFENATSTVGQTRPTYGIRISVKSSPAARDVSRASASSGAVVRGRGLTGGRGLLRSSRLLRRRVGCG